MFLKTLKTLSPWTFGDIPIRKGNCNILVIAPHGHKKDDKNTGEIARQIADILDCYAVINEFYRKPLLEKANKNKGWVDLNNLDQIKGQLDKEEFIEPIKKFKDEIVNRFGMAQIFLIHGITDKNIKDESKIMNADPELDALIGIGRGIPNEDLPFEDRLSAHPDIAAKLIELLQSNNEKKIIAAEALQGHGRGGYAGWDKRNLNQLFRDKNKKDPNVHSIQIEIKMTGYRNDAQVPNTAIIFADAFRKMDSFKTVGILTAPDEDDIDFVDRAYTKLSDIIYSNIGNAIFEAGKFIVNEFYNNDIELVKSKNPVKKVSLNKLIKKIQNDNNKQLSRSWVFNAVKLYVETKELETTVQTYGQLSISQKILLFPIHDRNTKLQLIQDAVKNKYTVVELKNKIAELMANAKPEIEAPKGLLQVIKNPDLLFSANYALDIKSLSELKPSELDKIYEKAKANLLDIEHDIEDIEFKLTTQQEHVRNYKKLLKSVEIAKLKGKDFAGGGLSDQRGKKHAFRYDGNTGIAESKEFKKKLLADLSCNIGCICEFGCTFCYVPTITTKQKYVQAVLKKDYKIDEISLYRSKDNVLNTVKRDLIKIKPGDNREVIFCTTCDPCATEEHADITTSAIKLIMKSSDLQVRVLSKSVLIMDIASELEGFRDRIIYSLSTGTIRPEISACIEGNASPIEERIKILKKLQADGFRTYGMLCPILPSEMDKLDILIDEINPTVCEHVWAEAINVRGKSLVNTREQLIKCGLKEDAEAIGDVMGDKEIWRDYSKDLFLNLQAKMKKRGMLHKFRFLQYVKKEPTEFKKFFENQEGAVCL